MSLADQQARGSDQHIDSIIDWAMAGAREPGGGRTIAADCAALISGMRTVAGQRHQSGR
jgi:hypothetical protein